MTMPETSVYENRRPILSHDYVGLAWHALHVEAITIAVPPQPLPHFQFGLGVLAADARHAVVALGGSETVSHVVAKSFLFRLQIYYFLYFCFSKIAL